MGNLQPPGLMHIDKSYAIDGVRKKDVKNYLEESVRK
jgi:hypothetical protein